MDSRRCGFASMNVRSVWQCDGGSTFSLKMLFKGEHCLIKLFQWSKDLNPSKIIEKG